MEKARIHHKKMQESIVNDPIFDIFRKQSHVNVQWVKEQVYGSPCIPEKCPCINSFLDTMKSLELEEGEIRDNTIQNKMKF